MTATGFRVIVVGGGPVGLTAANALHAAGIDFVVLERRDAIVEDIGSSLILEGCNIRVLSQLGMLDQLLETGTEFYEITSYTKEGRKFGGSKQMGIMKEACVCPSSFVFRISLLLSACLPCLWSNGLSRFGAAPHAYHRAELVQIIYDNLPEAAKAKVLAKKQVEAISQTDDNVTVTCADGTSYTGSILIGADGVYSFTRRYMREQTLKANPKADWDAEKPFTAYYKCFWCNFPLPESAVSGSVTDTQAKGQSGIFIPGKKRAWVFMFEKLPQPTNEYKKYTSEDIDAFAGKYAEWAFSDKIKFKDVFIKENAGMSLVEEGVVKNLSHGRLVIAGDANHKYTPNGGLGLNNGIQDIVCICNLLHRAVKESNNGQPSAKSLTRVFADFSEERLRTLNSDMTHSWVVSRVQAWDNWMYRFLAWYLLSIVDPIMARYRCGVRAKDSLVLDYVPAEEPFSGSYPWRHLMPRVADDKASSHDTE